MTGSDLTKRSPAGLARRLLAAAYQRALSWRWLVHLGQWAVTGERASHRLRLFADEITAGSHDFVLDLGCGEAPLLDYIRPSRYVGIDSHEPSLAEARRLHAIPGRDFVLADLDAVDYSQWRGADVVTIASVTHHLADDEVVSLLAQVADEIRPRRILISDAEPSGVLGPLVRALDDGDHFRTRDQLAVLLAPRFASRFGPRYKNRARSFHHFVLDLRPQD